jgi:hypothetical protein
VAGHAERVEAEVRHDRDRVSRHRALECGSWSGARPGIELAP